jgi:hypothetical protein
MTANIIMFILAAVWLRFILPGPWPFRWSWRRKPQAEQMPLETEPAPVEAPALPPALPLVVQRTDLTFERWDGKTAALGCVHCVNCKNFWFVLHLEIEPPPFCCYCGQKFKGMRVVTNEELREDQAL